MSSKGPLLTQSEHLDEAARVGRLGQVIANREGRLSTNAWSICRGKGCTGIAFDTILTDIVASNKPKSEGGEEKSNLPSSGQLRVAYAGGHI